MFSRATFVEKKALDDKLQQAFERLIEMETALHQMKKTYAELLEARVKLALMEKAANPLVKALVPEDSAHPVFFLDRLEAVPRQLKAFMKKSS